MSQSDASKGHIALVGAGPGDPDLLTLRAVARLGAADVVLYDDLGSAGALAHAREEAELISVGKRAGRHAPKQAEVSRLMVAYAALGKRVVRLKSGDPTIFSRADEEICAAHEAGFSVEIVPGVTTATAAAAHLGAALTKRLVARRVQFVTAHEVTGHLPDDLDLGALADPLATTCVFMGKATFPALAEKLFAHGLSVETPAAVVESLGTERTAVIKGTVETVAARLKENPPEGACMILYGAALADVCRA
ncbi:Uroporphyrinogen-III methyltransferase [Rhodovulum sp. PH10]|uniref:uroporphyrinogen-III C-methyltransferase n=1 Tax=Rhodovulum sp. PH10 TaxID=1187851 RepID=UPI00027C24A5|nr:uroporphyrinogen-III C-methyltransferase [Rhodovulum sp. PH10]EJW13091.1 Uroporphyrinogen-III methyltransferase [Rhodovulum sp. PH10]